MRLRARCVFAWLALLFAAGFARAQATVPVVLLSDIHFDPFHNPHLLPQLQAAPVERWPAILEATPDLVEDVDRAAMDVECRVRGVDTAWPLLNTALAAAHESQPHPLFVTLSGDLLSHGFNCKFHKLAPSASAQQLSAFAAKTMAFVAQQLRARFPGVPVYVALGNNDSGCGDYRETAGSPFMQSFDAIRVGAEGGKEGRSEVSTEGDYSLALPAPLQHGRLIVLEDIFDAEGYRDCSGQATRAAELDQMGWLRTQLAQARTRHEQVWVMAHIPPGVDVFRSFATYVLRPGEMCSAEPKPFLGNTGLADALLSYADVVRLAIFAHTHMDEIRLLHQDGAPAGAAGDPASKAASVPAKLVPSISPYFGNHPAFLVASVDPATLVLKDWQTFVSPTAEGSAGPWPMAYRFSTTYHLSDFSAASLEQLAAGFASDRSGREPRSSAYREHFFAGDPGLYALGLSQIWPAYACSVRENRIDRFHQCLCAPGAAGKDGR